MKTTNLPAKHGCISIPGIGNLNDVQESVYTQPGTVPSVRPTVRDHSYDDEVWYDRLTEFNGKTITYDAIGNPTSIGSTSLSWEGRSLVEYTDGANTYSYEYDMSGHRISKTVNGTTTEYFYDGDQLVAQKSGNDRITFMFDAQGSAYGFYYNNAPYFFIKNIQGDVTAITNFAGTVIGTYTYDAWGNLILEASDLSDEVAAMNPIRYRGYYYDAETGYYFLNSRYYDAEMGRFLNADTEVVLSASPMNVTDKSLFAYCNNNPIIYVDYTGELSYIAISTILGGVAGLFDGLYSELLEYIYDKSDSFDPWDVVISTVAGIAEGALIAIFPANAYGISVGVNFVATLLDEGREYFVDDEALGVCIINIILGTGFDALFGLSENSIIDEKFVSDMSSAIKNAFGDGIHPVVKSAAKKSFKDGMKAAAKDQGKDFLEGLATGGMQYFFEWYLGTIFSVVFNW